MRNAPESIVARALMMSEDTWLRHANPWSVWTRITTCLPLLILAIWSRVWLGWWSLMPVAASILWIWLNPRVFPKPRSTDNWASQGVLGERVWLNRKSIRIPTHHRIAPNILSGVGALGLLPLLSGLWKLSLCPTLIGFILVYAGKLWFFDRMVWLYRDMGDVRDADSQKED
jgi:hypothetical protein